MKRSFILIMLLSLSLGIARVNDVQAMQTAKIPSISDLCGHAALLAIQGSLGIMCGLSIKSDFDYIPQLRQEREMARRIISSSEQTINYYRQQNTPNGKYDHQFLAYEERSLTGHREFLANIDRDIESRMFWMPLHLCYLTTLGGIFGGIACWHGWSLIKGLMARYKAWHTK